MTDNTLFDEAVETIRSAAKLPRSVVVLPESRLIEDLGIDSLDLVGVLVALQDRWEVFIDDSDVARLKTVQDVIDFLIENRPDLAGAPERSSAAV